MADSVMDLDEYLRRHGIWHRFVPKRETVHTADASMATGIDLHRITKNLVSVTDTGEHVVLVIPGDRRVDLKAAAKALGAKNIRLLPFDEAEAFSGYPPGATPSLGFKVQMRVVVDRELTNFDTLYCGGGSRDRLLEVRVEDVVRLNGATVAPMSKAS